MSTTTCSDPASEFLPLMVPVSAYPHALSMLATLLGDGETTLADPASSPEDDDAVDLPWVNWSTEDLSRLRQIANTGSLAAMELAAANPGQPVTFSQVLDGSGLSVGQLRGHLAGLTQTVKRRFGRRNWPIRATYDPSEQEMRYSMDESTAARWSEPE